MPNLNARTIHRNHPLTKAQLYRLVKRAEVALQPGTRFSRRLHRTARVGQTEAAKSEYYRLIRVDAELTILLVACEQKCRFS